MSLLRILRNLAVLAILTVGGLGLTPRPAAITCNCQPCAPLCSSHVTGCKYCYCPLLGCGTCRGHGVYVTCYDTYYHRCCQKNV